MHPVWYADEITSADRALEVHQVSESRSVDWTLPFVGREDFRMDMTTSITFEVIRILAHHVATFFTVHSDRTASICLL